MHNAFQVVGLVSRLYLAIFFGLHAAQAVTQNALQPLAQHPGLASAPALNAAVMALLGLISIWLLLGLRSRVVAILGLVICTASHILHGEAWTHVEVAAFWSWDRLTAFAAMLALSMTGGGLFRLHAGGWRLKDCL